MYFLLLSRKERQPSVEDEARAPGEGNLRGMVGYGVVTHSYATLTCPRSSEKES